MSTLTGNAHVSLRSFMDELPGSGLLSMRLEMDELTGNAELITAIVLHGNANLMKQFTMMLDGNGLLSERLLLSELPGNSLLSERALMATLPGNAILFLRPAISLPGNALLSARLLMTTLTGNAHICYQLLMDTLTGNGLVAQRTVMSTLPGNAEIIIRSAMTIMGSAELHHVGMFMLGGFDLSGHMYGDQSDGGELRISNQKMRKRNRVTLQDEGSNPSTKTFALLWGSAAEKEAFQKAVPDRSEDLELYWYRSDRYYRVKYVSISPTRESDEPQKRLYLQDVVCYLEEPSLWYYKNETVEPGLSILPWTSGDITNFGTLESPVLFRIQGKYNSGQLTSVYVKQMDTAIEDKSLYIGSQVLSKEAAELTIDGALKYYLTHTYETDYSDNLYWPYDAVQSGCTLSGGQVSVPSGAWYYYKFRGNPLKENISLLATITVGAGVPLIQLSLDGLTWSTAVAATEIVSGKQKEYFITGSEGYQDVYVRFYSPVGSSMTVQDVLFTMYRDISSQADQIPSIEPGDVKQIKFTGSGSARAYLAPDFRSRWQA